MMSSEVEIEFNWRAELEFVTGRADVTSRADD